MPGALLAQRSDRSIPKAVANIIPVSPYDNHDVGDLADEIGKLCAEIADLEARRKNFREELIRRGVAEAEGALFRATVSEAVRWTIDSARVKAEMGATWWDARCRQSLVTTVAVKARTGSTKLAA